MSTSNQFPSHGTPRAFERLMQTSVYRDGQFCAWAGAVVGIVGAGTTGGRLAAEAVLSGVGEVRIFDPAVAKAATGGNQLAEPGEVKVESICRRCDAIRAGHARGYCVDIRHAGVRALWECAVIVDCTDDAQLV